jgi:hypothetical protein
VTSRRAFLAFATAATLSAGTKKYCGIRFQEIRNGRSPRRYFWIHGDELTARDVLLGHMKRFQGRALLVDNPTRVIKMPPVEFDPNRMFTAVGLERNLKRLNPDATPEERQRELVQEMELWRPPQVNILAQIPTLDNHVMHVFNMLQKLQSLKTNLLFLIIGLHLSKRHV